MNYNRYGYYGHYEVITLGGPSSSNDDTPEVEYRAITLWQLIAVMKNIERRCVEEGWEDFNGNKLTPEKVNLHDAVKYVIRPFTVDQQCDFVTRLPSTAGPQPPRKFASHCWAEPVKDFIKCIEQHVRDFARTCEMDQ